MNKQKLLKSIIIEKNILSLKQLEKSTKYTPNINCPILECNDNNKQGIFNLSNSKYDCKGCGIEVNHPIDLYSKITGKPQTEAFYYCVNILNNMLDENKVIENKVITKKELSVINKPYEEFEKVLKEIEVYNYLKDLVSSDVIEKLTVPVIINKRPIFDWEIIWENPNDTHQDKMNPNGFIVPFDIWQQDKNTTYIVGSFQDMVIARTNGFNAICITGGISDLPKAFYTDFKDRDIVISYPEKLGKIDYKEILASEILKNTNVKSLKVITHSNDKEVLLEKVKNTLDIRESSKDNPFIRGYIKENLETNLKDKKFNTWFACDFKSTITYDETYSIAKVGEWYCSLDELKDILEKLGEKTQGIWELDKSSPEELKKIIIDKVDVKTIIKNRIKSSLYKALEEGHIEYKSRITQLLEFVKFETRGYESIAKAYIATEKKPNGAGHSKVSSEIEAYSIGNYRWESSSNYSGLVKFEHSDTRVVAIVKNSMLKESAWLNFKITDEVKKSLDKFKRNDLTVEAKVDDLFKRFKHPTLGGHTIDRNIFLAYETVYNSVKKFRMFKEDIFPTRGVIYNFIIGESGSGKTECGKKMSTIYGAGEFIDLKNATPTSLIGGTKTVNKEQKKTLGVLAQLDGSLAILDETHGAPEEFRKKLSVAKADNRISISRMDGQLSVELFVRLVEIANQKSPKPIENYKHGVDIIWEQLGAASEEWRRYDAFFLRGAISVANLKSRFDKDYDYKDPLDKKDYHNRLRWVWSRQEDDIIFADNLLKYIDKKAKELMFKYKIHAQIFPVETDKKLIRFAIAIAASQASCSDDYQKILVEKEHLDWVIKWIEKLYDNELFRINLAVADERKYVAINPGDEKVYTESIKEMPLVISTLIEQGSESKRTLHNISSAKPDRFNYLFTQLIIHHMIRKDKGLIFMATPKLVELEKMSKIVL